MRLEVSDLQVGYDVHQIIQNLNIAVPDGQITTIIGANGCGKSTLLKAITRLIPHQSGSVILDGRSIDQMNTKALARELAILPQNPESASGLLVEELVSYGRFPHQKGFNSLSKKDKAMIDWALAATTTTEFRKRTVDSLSGGQKQRVWIALALAQETDIILLDEPTTYLDMAHQLEILELLEQLNQEQKRTIVMVLHDLNHAARFSDYLIALTNGQLIKAGTPAEIMQKDILRKVFQIEAVIGEDPCTKKPICITYNLNKKLLVEA